MDLNEWAKRWGVPPQGLFELDRVLYERVDYTKTEGDTCSEQAIQQKMRLEACKVGMRLWRNNSGAVTTQDGRHIRFGLANDSTKINKVIKSSDLIGITPVLIQQYHLNQTLGVFTSIEVKKPGWRYSANNREKAQNNWLNAIRSLGGFACFANDPATINEIIKVR